MKHMALSHHTHRARRRAATLTALATALAVCVGLGPASAAIIYTGGIGETVYGVAPYGPPAQPFPVFGLNNVTGFNDVLLSPGHGFLLADPSVPHNIADTGLRILPLKSFQIGGGNLSGPFGAGRTLINGPRIGFQLTDAFPGGGSASYSISSWDANYLVTPGGFAGNLGSYLSIGGRLPFVGSAGVASLVSNYYLNGVYVGQTTPLILAAAGNGNFQAVGGSGAILLFGPGKRYRGLAIDNVPAILAAGDTLSVVNTLTEYADPMSIDTIPLDPDLLSRLGTTLPDFSFGDAVGSVPEPAAWALMLIGFGALGGQLRRRRRSRSELVSGAASPTPG